MMIKMLFTPNVQNLTLKLLNVLTLLPSEVTAIKKLVKFLLELKLSLCNFKLRLLMKLLWQAFPKKSQ